ncbi:ester cyclase [Salinibacterium sp. ZJ454]|uniref:ester cyclase n=1 Tax=Salinibacterium sp. ZJ454 TaxID=2708339 RepID=UPI00141EE151|nr:ester cyclase [Salinibacterium sp. ZJ454]
MNARENFERAIEALNRHDMAAFARSYAPETLVYDPQNAEALRDRDAVEKDITEFIRAFPDIRFDIVDLLADEHTVAGRLQMSGTHQGVMVTPDGDIPPTGKTVTSEFSVFSRVNDDGEVVEEHRFYNPADLLAQVGVKQLQLG